MSVTLNLVSPEEGEIKRFLDKYFEKDTDVDEDVGEWVYTYNRPLEAIDMISAVMDNCDEYKLSLYIQAGNGAASQVTAENHNDIIKAILHVFYKEE